VDKINLAQDRDKGSAHVNMVMKLPVLLTAGEFADLRRNDQTTLYKAKGSEDSVMVPILNDLISDHFFFFVTRKVHYHVQKPGSLSSTTRSHTKSPHPIPKTLIFISSRHPDLISSVSFQVSRRRMVCTSDL
jgi:hypothetical protein